VEVTEANAFAWPEVYFPGLGWVEFNPTPNQGVVDRSVGAPPGGGSGDEDQSLFDFINQDPRAEQPSPGGSTAVTPQPAPSSDRTAWVLLGVVAGLAVLVATGAGALRFAWVRGLSGLSTPARLWGQTVRLGTWLRLPPDPGQTPVEYARKLRDEADIAEAGFLAGAFVRNRYGAREPDAEDAARLETAWRVVRQRLLRRLIPGR
jgi:hypothetical protein